MKRPDRNVGPSVFFDLARVMFVKVYYRYIVANLKGTMMRKANGIVAILKALAVFAFLTDLALITFSDSFSLGILFIFADSLLIIGIACCSILCEDLDENRSRITRWLISNVFVWGLSVVLLLRYFYHIRL